MRLDDGGLERRLHAEGFGLVAGADEAGRGALAGPLVAAAVVLPPDFVLPGLRDSKLLTAAARERLSVEIRRQATALSVVRVTPQRIDRDGLQRANIWALRRAVLRLEPAPEYALFDGFPVKRVPCPSLAVKKGDRIAACVAAASIIAKVTRDRGMRRLHRRYPTYNLRGNKGYGTAEHWAALREHGPSEIHRRSFYGVATPQMVLELEPGIGQEIELSMDAEMVGAP